MTSVKLINHSSSTADWNYYFISSIIRKQPVNTVLIRSDLGVIWFSFAQSLGKGKPNRQQVVQTRSDKFQLV